MPVPQPAPPVEVSPNLAGLVRPGPGGAAGPPAVTPTPGEFEAHLARHLAAQPTFARMLDSLNEAARAEEVARLRRRHAYRTSRVYADAHRIHRLGCELHLRMTNFAEDYGGREGVAVLKAAGLSPPPKNSGETRPAVQGPRRDRPEGAAHRRASAPPGQVAQRPERPASRDGRPVRGDPR